MKNAEQPALTYFAQTGCIWHGFYSGVECFTFMKVIMQKNCERIEYVVHLAIFSVSSISKSKLIRNLF